VGSDSLAALRPWAWPALLVGALLTVIGGILVWRELAMEVASILMVLGVVLAVVGVVGVFAPPIGTECDPATDPGCVPPPPPGYVADWNCDWWDISTSAVGDAHDAVTEFPDTPFIAADAGTPDLNKVIMVPTYDVPAKNTLVKVAIDDDLATTATGYIATDTFAWDVNCQLMNPTQAVGGGLQEIPIWARLSPSRTSGTINNGSYADVFYCDITAGVYLGVGTIADSGVAAASHTNDHRYVSYTNSKVCNSPAPLVGDWIPLGTSDGDTDGEWWTVWLVLHYGFSDYTTPALNSRLTVKVEAGTTPGHATYKGNVDVNTLDLLLDART
jgi:hypothetical protein